MKVYINHYLFGKNETLEKTFKKYAGHFQEICGPLNFKTRLKIPRN